MTESSDPRALLRVLEQRARRRFGQHFLARPAVVRRIVAGAGVAPGDRVVEIGPGLGALTEALLAAGADLVAIEVDRDLAAFLLERHPTLRLVEADATRVRWDEVLGDARWSVVANLPYNVGTGLVMDLLRLPERFSRLTVMLQLEVAQRLVAVPGTKAYGALTVQAQARARPTLLFQVPPESFHPRPKVDSAVVRLDVHEAPDVGPAGPRAFDRVVRAAFAHRRKTVANSLRATFDRSRVDAALDSAGIDGGLRAERLGRDAFKALAAALFAEGEGSVAPGVVDDVGDALPAAGAGEDEQ